MENGVIFFNLFSSWCIVKIDIGSIIELIFKFLKFSENILGINFYILYEYSCYYLFNFLVYSIY